MPAAIDPRPTTRSVRSLTVLASSPGFIVFVLVFLAYAAIRTGLPNYIFDDTRHIYAGHVASGGMQRSITASEVLDVLRSEFSNGSTREYRPLSFAQHRLIVARYAPDLSERPWIPMILVALGWALTAALHCALARRLTGSTRVALLSTALFVTAMPVLTGAWIVVMGWQWVVTATILAGLLCYLQYKRQPRMRWLALILALALVGSWFREFSGLFVFIALANELLFEPRKSPALLAVLAVAGLHVMFPAFLPSLLFPAELQAIALKPVYKLGPVGALSAGGSKLLDVNALRPDALYHFMIQFSPLLWLLAIGGFMAGACRIAPRYFLTPSWSRAIAQASQNRWFHRGVCALFILSGIAAAFGVFSANYHPALVGGCFLFYLLITMSALPAAPLLTLYALFALLPFLKIYLHEVHLAYAIAPAAILLAMLVRSLWGERAARYGGPGLTMAKIAFFGIVSLVLVDAALNVLGNTRAVTAVYEGASERAQWLRRHVPRGAIVVGNFIDLRDTLLYAPEYFQPYFTIAPHWEPHHANTPEAMLELIERESGRTPIYLLGAVFPRSADKYGYHHMHYLSTFAPDAKQRHRFTTRARYPYADPLKSLLPDALTPYPGPPDLVDDYWVGKERGGSPMMREFFADYLLVKIEGLSQAQKESLLSAERGGKLLGEYRGFNLFRTPEDAIVSDLRTGQPVVNSEVMVIDQEVGAIPIMEGRRGRRYADCASRGRCFITDSTESARARIDARRAH